MANVRTLNKDKYNISNYRFRELYYFCLQYPEWKQALDRIRNTLKGLGYDSFVSSGLPGDPTMNAAIQSMELANKCQVIERAAELADSELQEYIIYAVTHENVTFNALKNQQDMPCERDRYYNSRRKFYWLLDRILRKSEERQADEDYDY